VIPILTAEEMRAADRYTIEAVGLAGAVLMENAGAAVARVVRERFPTAGSVAILCGKGNNGGDGFVTARRLLELRPTVLLLGAREDVKGDAHAHLRAFERSGGRCVEVRTQQEWRARREKVLRAAVLVDAVLGTGLNAAPRGLVAHVLADVAARRRGPVVAVDVPSGISADGGRVPGAAIPATLTVTFAALKCGLVIPPASALAGECVVADIGIPSGALAGARLGWTEARDAGAAWGRRGLDVHKGSFGHVLVIAGSVGKTGAAILSGTGALRAGAGLVTVATPAPALARVAAGRAELMTEALPVTRLGGLAARAVVRALELSQARHAVVLGPGLGQAPATRAFVRRFVAACPAPLIIDADALNALAALPEAEVRRVLRRRKAPTLLTPHPGEMGRLLGWTTKAVQADRLAAARRLSEATGAVVVLKGYRTIVAEAGGRAAVNPTGNPGLAIGGAGDVLAGAVGALLARGCDAFTAAAAAVYAHGLAADRVAAERGAEGMLAGDVAHALPLAIRSLPR
jgi:NAD(P)H-hydrate epimerase